MQYQLVLRETERVHQTTACALIFTPSMGHDCQRYHKSTTAVVFGCASPELRIRLRRILASNMLTIRPHYRDLEMHFHNDYWPRVARLFRESPPNKEGGWESKISMQRHGDRGENWPRNEPRLK